MQEKIESVNSGDYIYYIDKVILFGSYVNAPEKEKVGDVDIAVYISLRNNSVSEYQQNKERYNLSGKRQYNGITDMIKASQYGITEIRNVLKQGTPVIAPDFISTTFTDDSDKAEDKLVHSDKHIVLYERIKEQG